MLILRDVLDWSAKETAEALGDSVAAVNSALQRARAGLERARSLGAPAHVPERGTDEQALLGRFMAAWDAVDINAIVSLLARDAMMAMPPEPFYVRGAPEVGAFFATVPLGGRLDEIRLVPTAANGRPAWGQYRPSESGDGYDAWALQIVELGDDGIAEFTFFLDTKRLFPLFGLPPRLEP